MHYIEFRDCIEELVKEKPERLGIVCAYAAASLILSDFKTKKDVEDWLDDVIV